MKVTKAYHQIRRSWGQTNPVTKVIPDKKKYQRNSKHRNNHEE